MKLSQNKTVLQHLLAGKAISTWTAIRKWHITRLAARVSDLRNEGYDIYGKMIQAHEKKYKVYYMEGSPWFIAHGKNY